MSNPLKDYWKPSNKTELAHWLQVYYLNKGIRFNCHKYSVRKLFAIYHDIRRKE